MEAVYLAKIKGTETYYYFTEEPCLAKKITRKKHDIIKLEELPEDNFVLTNGMCGGCISITFVLRNNRVVRGHFDSSEYEDKDYVQDFFEQMRELLNNEILEIRIYAPVNTAVRKNQVKSANGVLASLNMLRKMDFPLDKVSFIEGSGSEYRFFKDVHGTKLRTLRGKPEDLILITDICTIEENMNNIIKIGGQSEGEIMKKYQALTDGDCVITEPRLVEEDNFEQTVDPYIWMLANEAVERYLKDEEYDPGKDPPAPIPRGWIGDRAYKKSVKYLIDEFKNS